MTFRNTNPQLLLGICLSLAFIGCSGDDRPETARASGKVTLNGVPVVGASVMFQPVAGGRPGTGITDDNGVYKISSYGQPDDGVAVGEHKVSVVKIAGAGAYALSPAESAKPVAAASSTDSLSEIPAATDDEQNVEPEIEYLVPQKYQNPETSGLRITVPSGGSSELHLELSIN